MESKHVRHHLVTPQVSVEPSLRLEFYIEPFGFLNHIVTSKTVSNYYEESLKSSEWCHSIGWFFVRQWRSQGRA